MAKNVKYVAFGDSLSTPGSSGPEAKVWSEYFTESIGSTPNIYAYGGATSFDLPKQVNSYKNSAQDASAEKVIYSLWTGGNDLLGGLVITSSSLGIAANKIAAINPAIATTTTLFSVGLTTTYIGISAVGLSLFAVPAIGLNLLAATAIGSNLYNTYNAVQELNAINDGGQKQFILIDLPPLNEFQAVKELNIGDIAVNSVLAPCYFLAQKSIPWLMDQGAGITALSIKTVLDTIPSYNLGTQLVDQFLAPAYYSAKNTICSDETTNVMNSAALLIGGVINYSINSCISLNLKAINLIQAASIWALSSTLNHQGISTTYISSGDFYSKIPEHFENSPGYKAQNGFSNAVFYDGLHPSDAYHELFSQYVYDKLLGKDSTIPDDFTFIRNIASELKSWNLNNKEIWTDYCNNNKSVSTLPNADELISIFTFNGDVEKFKTHIKDIVMKYNAQMILPMLYEFESATTDFINDPYCDSYNKYLSKSEEIINMVDGFFSGHDA
jgi:phospholipase/lecithinase/hemolysin